MKRSPLAAVALGVTVAAALGGCSAGSAGASDARVRVLASFYPLQYVAQQVGGADVRVDSLTPPGAEPHDLELSPRQVHSMVDADLVLVLGGLQPSVDAAVAERAPARLVDAAQVPTVAAHLTGHGGADDGHAHAGGADPHFWLDPALLADLASPVADALADADPAHADAYRSRADELVASLTDLDAQMAAGLATCDQRVVVTSHAAFGYLAERYHLEQVGLSGLDPEAEPSPARLREISDVVRAQGVTTIFTEALVSPKVARTLADDLGVATAVLDPVESQVDPKRDYRGVMLANLDALRTALGCR